MALLGNLTGSSQFFNDTAFYNGVATQSLRFDQSSSAFLHRTPSGAGNQQIWTFSTWYKLGSTFDSTLNIFSPHTGGDGSNESQMMIDYVNHGGKLRIYDSGGTRGDVQTSRIFRDPSAWYNIVISLDLTQATDTNRVKIYVNGVQETLAGTFPSQNTSWGWNGTSAHRISSYRGGTPFQDGYLSETIMVDGTQLAPTSFGETKNGVWIPKKYTGSYGTNGFRLQFNQTGTGTASASTIGADTSGNTNHWTSSGIVASDCSLFDSPENNFATLNPLDKSFASSALSEGNLSVSAGTGNAWNNIINSTFSLTSGKWYWEVYQNGTGGFGKIGVRQNNSLTSADSHSAGASEVYLFNGNKQQGSTSTDSSYYGSAMYADGNIFGVALDMDAGKIWVAKANTYGGSADPTTGNGAMFTNLTEPQSPSFSSYNMAVIFNFGQDGSFAGELTSGIGTATDGNGNGAFKYAPPTGYKALCTANLPEPTISPNSATQADDHFNTVLYTGNGSAATHTVGFRPNLVWGKKRGTNAQNHWLINDVGDIDAFMSSDNDASESTTAGTTFNATSFTTASNDLYYNNNSPYVVWAWKGNGTGTAVSNSNGSITSTVSANTTAGFSIITYSGNATKGATIGHGLSSAPEMIWFKRRDGSAGWAVYNKDLTDNGYALLLNSNASQDNRNTQFLNETSPSSTLITLGDWNEANGGSSTYVAYAFHSVDGYSKIGKYTGNGSTDGVFINLGFRPAWVILKNIVRSADWRINDATRQDVNDEGGHLLLANSNSAEITNEYDIDFLSNGFKLRGGDVYENGSNEAFIYMAFAEAPFKYANAE